jgi:CheY-like chemotaxis protein
MRQQQFNVLLVEDNLDHAELVIRSFSEHHLENTMHHVRDGEAALDYLFHRGLYRDAATSPSPDVVLLDLRLPKVDGLEVLKQVKADKYLRLIPVVILTTSAAEIDLVKAYEDYANSYLVKPVDFDKFTRLMSDLHAYWLDWNQHA